MKHLMIAPIALGVLMGCNEKTKFENDKLVATIDSLETVIDANAYTVSLLEQIGQYMDSIDFHRKWIKIDLETGLTEEDYVERMRQLNQYVQKAEWTIGELEKTRSAYASQVKRLKAEIQQKDQEINQLMLSVALYEQANEQLEDRLQVSETELLSTQLDLEMTQDDLNSTKGDLNRAESDIQDLVQKVQLTEAEALYAQGEGMEEVARHIQLAPKRKRLTLESALEFYIASLDKGYEPARSKADSLRQKLKSAS